ncbi:hypothetical protein ACFL6Y_11820, partial [Elusimicrobiota bacterium]
LKIVATNKMILDGKMDLKANVPLNGLRKHFVIFIKRCPCAVPCPGWQKTNTKLYLTLYSDMLLNDRQLGFTI